MEKSKRGPESGRPINIDNITEKEREQIGRHIVPGPSDKCWNYAGGTFDGKYKYGQIRWRGKTIRCHRLSYSIYKGAIPEDALIRHTCNNTFCQNPNHLILGSHIDNMDDRTISGNTRFRGSGNPKAKLQQSDIYLIHEDWHNGYSLKEIALKYNVHTETIRYIATKQSWGWLNLIFDKTIREKAIASRRK